MFKYLARKLVYIVVGTGTVAAGAYLSGHPEINTWTMPGLLGAVSSALAGALLSGMLGGSLSKKP